MQVENIISKTLADVLAPIHRTRGQSLSAAVSSALSGHALSVTSLGRGLRGPVDEKHQIKRMDRLLSNRHLQGERVGIYRAVALKMLGSCQRPVIAVDWSDLDGCQRHFLLRASLLTEGRSLTLYEEVHPLSGKDKPASHAQLLRQLQAFLPSDAQPVMVTDAGFRTPWFKQVLALGWDYVGRVRNRHLVRHDSQDDWVNAKPTTLKRRRGRKSWGTLS